MKDEVMSFGPWAGNPGMDPLFLARGQMMESRMKIWIIAAFAFSAAAATAQQAVPPSKTQSEVETQERAAQAAESVPAQISAEEAKARRTLEEAGYTDIREMKQDGEVWSAVATHNGQQVKVRVAQDGKPVKSPV
jgi:hypothetical protein